jgi:hypothetical protein
MVENRKECLEFVPVASLRRPIRFCHGGGFEAVIPQQGHRNPDFVIINPDDRAVSFNQRTARANSGTPQACNRREQLHAKFEPWTWDDRNFSHIVFVR